MTPSLDQTNLFARVPAPPGVIGVPGPRYALGEILGSGSSGTVFAARDTNFERTVAVKVIDGQVVGDAERLAEFIVEARISATLDHPNIVPVYDMDRTADGGVYLTMKVVTGDTLAAALDLAQAGSPPVAIATINDRLNVILQVANAVACAHHRRIVHRDIKPANILLGRFGEVFLVDWGAALQLPASGPAPAVAMRIGTPLYMSPEQARCEGIDEGSDIYCLGATLFHLLLGRVPTEVDDPARFWDRKSAGELDLPTRSELATLPRRLVAILNKALCADRAQRYATIEDFAADIRAIQSGGAVAAYREPWWEHLARWIRQRRRGMSITVLVGTVLLLGGGLWFDSWQKDRARWGDPLLVEHFDSTWYERWQEVHVDSDSDGFSDSNSSFVPVAGAVETRGGGPNFLYFKQRLSGRVAIDFIGEMVPGTPAGDLSVVWSADDPFAPLTPGARPRQYLLQVGAEDNLYASLMRSSDEVRLAVAPYHLEAGHRYHIRAEIDGAHLMLMVDGQVLLEHDDELPFVSGWIGFYGYYPGKRFSDVTLHVKGVPERVGALAIGDSDAQDGLWRRAAEQYRRVQVSHPGTPLGEEARYRQGLALRLTGDRSAAQGVWAMLREEPWLGLIASWQARDAAAAGDHAAALAIFAKFMDKPTTAMLTRHRALTWIAGVVRAIEDQDRTTVERYLTWQARCMPNEKLTQEPAARAYLWLGQPQVVIERFAASPRAYAQALQDLGRFNEVLANSDSLQDRVKAQMTTGRFMEVLRDAPQVGWATGRARYMMGDGAAIVAENRRNNVQSDPFILLTAGLVDEAAAQVARADLNERSDLLMLLDRPEEALSVGPPARQITALLAADRAREVLEQRPLDPIAAIQAHADLAIQALARGDQAAARRELDWLAAEPERIALGPAWWIHWLLVPWVQAREGDPQAIARAVERLGPVTGEVRWHNAQRPWNALRYLAGITDDRPVVNQTARYEGASTALYVRALRLDLANDPAAGSAWAAWLALPPHQRVFTLLYRDPVAERLARWRLVALKFEGREPHLR